MNKEPISSPASLRDLPRKSWQSSPFSSHCEEAQPTRQSQATKTGTFLLNISLFICGVIVALGTLNLYRLTARHLVLENWLLEQEINDYVTARLNDNNIYNSHYEEQSDEAISGGIK